MKKNVYEFLFDLFSSNKVLFTKMNGTGNDFILIDNRNDLIPFKVMSFLAKIICERKKSIGADGLIFISSVSKETIFDFRWDFFNADGSQAEMCGNGARCASRFAVDLGIAKSVLCFKTLAGPIKAWVKDSTVKLEMTKPNANLKEIKLRILNKELVLVSVNTGVPHVVIETNNLDELDIFELGKTIRFHQFFKPNGTNVNFVCLENQKIKIRTYERGVENETLACGTGAVASALVLGLKKKIMSPIIVKVRSGDELKVYYELNDNKKIEKTFLEGPTSYVYNGILHSEAIY